MDLSLQERYAPHSRCFGCGPANSEGLQIKSYVEGEKVIATFRPAAYFLAFENVLCGGICGLILDCHSNWTASYALMTNNGLESPPCTVTAEFSVKLRKPTPMDQLLTLEAIAIEVTDRKAIVEASIRTDAGESTATFHGIFVSVPKGHAIFHR
jgi:acyl-coenzyme A thioesterase PaaI-like protein